MARLRHSVVLTPVPRAWFEQTVAMGWDVLDEHLDDRPADVTVEEWHRHGQSAGRFTVTDENGTTTCHVRLRSAAAPRTLELDGGTGDGRRLTTFTGRLRADFERWWSASARAGGRPAVTGRLRHALGLARFAVTPSPERDGRWRVEVVVHLRGRHVLWPVAAIGLLVARRALRRGFVDGMESAAQRWNEEVPKLIATPPDELRSLISAELSERPG